MSDYVRVSARTAARGQSGHLVAHLVPLSADGDPSWGHPGASKALCGAEPRSGFRKADADAPECERCAKRAKVHPVGTILGPFAVFAWARRLDLEPVPPPLLRAVVVGYVEDHFNDYAYEVSFVGQPGTFLFRHGEAYRLTAWSSTAIPGEDRLRVVHPSAVEPTSSQLEEAKRRLDAERVKAAAELAAALGLS